MIQSPAPRPSALLLGLAAAAFAAGCAVAPETGAAASTSLATATQTHIAPATPAPYTADEAHLALYVSSTGVMPIYGVSLPAEPALCMAATTAGTRVGGCH